MRDADRENDEENVGLFNSAPLTVCERSKIDELESDVRLYCTETVAGGLEAFCKGKERK